MTLAATLAAGGLRPASALPAITCSMCGEEIEIAAMGDHLCNTPSSDPAQDYISQAGNPFTSQQPNFNGQTFANGPLPSQRGQYVPQAHARTPTLGSSPNISSKPSRTAIQRINSEVANRPFLATISSGLDSPLSPRSNTRFGEPSYQRSATSPIPRLYDRRPPSPELSANLDCAFPPFPTSATSNRPSTSHGRRTPTGSDRAPSRGASRLEHVLTAEPESFNMEPKSPMMNAGGNVLQRLNTLKSGPFAGPRRQGSNESRDTSTPMDKRRPSEPAVEPHPQSPFAHPARTQSRRPSTPSMDEGHDEMKQRSKSSSPPRPTRPEDEILTPSFLDQFSTEPISAVLPPLGYFDSDLDKSDTIPLAQERKGQRPDSQTLSKVRSEPALGSTERRPSLVKVASSGPISPMPKQTHPPRGASRNAILVDYRSQDAPPVPRPMIRSQEASFHTPSESGSSAASATQSSTYTDSTHRSHETSSVGSSASSIDAFSPLGTGVRDGGENSTLAPGLNVRNQQKPGERAELRKDSSPPRPLARRAPSTNTAMLPEPIELPMDPTMQPRFELSSGSSPVIPLQTNQSQRLPLRTSSKSTTPPPLGHVPMVPALVIPQHSGPDVGPGWSDLSLMDRPQSPNISYFQYSSPSSAGSREPSPATFSPPPSRTRASPARGPTMSNKPKCRGCGHMIEGKSVKAADGRLTGRWHRACFTCRTCKQPFPAADFYVIDNEPYCEHDYHELNGSLCHGCHRGIEGQYLETTSTTRYGRHDKKFHPRCFTCSQCRTVLSDDYFEILNRVYCERHALAAMRANARMGGGGLVPPGRRDHMYAERRTTRLINPMIA